MSVSLTMQSEEQAAIKANSKKLQKAIKTKLESTSVDKSKLSKPPSKGGASAVPRWFKVIQGSATFD